MENIINSFDTLKLEPSIDDINLSSMTISAPKYGVIVVIHNNPTFNPHLLSFQNIELNIHKTSFLLYNNEFIMFEDNNPYKLQHELYKIYKIEPNNIRKIIKKEFGNINLHCVILNTMEIPPNETHYWLNLYDFIDIEVQKYISLYKYMVDSYTRGMNTYLNKEIQINYTMNNLNHLPPICIKLIDIYNSLC